MKSVTFTFDKCADCPFHKELWGMAYCPKLEDKRERNFSTYYAERNIHENNFSTYYAERNIHENCPLEDV